MIRMPTSEQNVLLNIFRNAAPGAAGLTDVELAVAWTRAGLRLGDLEVVLQELYEGRLLVSRANGGVQHISLTKAGRAAMDVRRRSLLGAVADWWHLEAVRRRLP